MSTISIVGAGHVGVVYAAGLAELGNKVRVIDINAKRDLYALFSALAGESLAIVMLSTELDEHVELMDRVLVFREHELSRELDRDELSREALVAAFFGESNAGERGKLR